MTTHPFPLPPGLPPTDTLYYRALTTSASTSDSERETYILFLPGNPGLIEYYRRFLGTLAALLARRVHVLGVSHAGFYSQQTAAREVVEGEGGGGEGYWTLAEQVEHKVRIVEWIAGGGATRREGGDGEELEGGKELEGEGEKKEEGRKRRRPRVILMGHSVGAYIAMETLRVLGERREKKRLVGGGGGGGGEGEGDGESDGDGGDEPEVFGGVMLFPTVVDIAKSPSGKILSVCIHSPLHSGGSSS